MQSYQNTNFSDPFQYLQTGSGAQAPGADPAAAHVWAAYYAKQQQQQPPPSSGYPAQYSDDGSHGMQ